VDEETISLARAPEYFEHMRRPDDAPLGHIDEEWILEKEYINDYFYEGEGIRSKPTFNHLTGKEIDIIWEPTLPPNSRK
jgi:hypothetical protein